MLYQLEEEYQRLKKLGSMRMCRIRQVNLPITIRLLMKSNKQLRRVFK